MNWTDELIYLWDCFMLSGLGNFVVIVLFRVRAVVQCSLIMYQRNKATLG